MNLIGGKMDDFIYIGKIVNTHGIRGEIRLLSDFDKKEKVFVPNMTLYIGRKKEMVKITSYRKHKNFDMICLEGFHDINEVLRFKGLYAYVKREDLNLGSDELLEEDYIGMDAWYQDNPIGKVIDIENRGRGNKIFVIEKDSKRILIPFQDIFIDSVSTSKGIIYLKNVEGLIS